MAQPTVSTQWAVVDESNMPNTNAPNKAEPSQDLKDYGIDAGTYPSSEEENYWKNAVHQHIEYIINERLATLDNLVSTNSPVGTIHAYPFSTEPSGYIFARGQVLLNSTPHTALRDLLISEGMPYGDDGSGSPKVPDTRGYFLRGLDAGAGVDGGRVLGSTQQDQNKAHTHTGTTDDAGEHSHDVDEGSSGPVAGGTLTSGDDYTNVVFSTNPTSTEPDHNHTFTTNSEGGSEVRVKNIAVNYIIKV